MSEYAKKTCYDCGIREPANRMERVTESYNSGQSNTKVTAGNLVFGAMGDKRGQNAVGRAIKGNNRRSYTRNRTVWKCQECSGTADHHRNEVRKDINSATKAIAKAEKGGIFAAPKNLPDEVRQKFAKLSDLNGGRGSQTSQDLLNEIKALIKMAPDAAPSKADVVVAKAEAKMDAASAKMDAGFAKAEAKMDAGFAKAEAKMDAGLANSWIDAKTAEMEAKTAEMEAKNAARRAEMAQSFREAGEKTRPVLNFMLSAFAFMGWFLGGMGVLSAALGGDLADAAIVSAIGFGWAMGMRKLKR